MNKNGENVINIYIHKTGTRCYDKVPISDVIYKKKFLLKRKISINVVQSTLDITEEKIDCVVRQS